MTVSDTLVFMQISSAVEKIIRLGQELSPETKETTQYVINNACVDILSAFVKSEEGGK